MSKNKKIGDEGEDQALDFLTNRGYELMERNFRYSHGEIDLILKNNNTLVFVEVKVRTGSYFGFPEEWVDEKKEELIIEAADHYINRIDWKGQIRFDIIAILNGKTRSVKHFVDAFY